MRTVCNRRGVIEAPLAQPAGTRHTFGGGTLPQDVTVALVERHDHPAVRCRIDDRLARVGQLGEIALRRHLAYRRGDVDAVAPHHRAGVATTDSTFLDGQYTAFGEVTEGMDVADKIVNLQRDNNDCPLEEAKMLQVSIE